jgi:large subunit ribosomal protein L9
VKTIQVLLTENVDNLGIVGDVVKVKPGYARNFLLPRGYATEPTKGNIARLAEKRAQMEELLRVRRGEMEKLMERIKGHEMTMMRAANEQGVLFGGVSQHDIAEQLRAEGFPLDDRAVRIGEQIKRLDSYSIPIVLANDLKTEIKLWVVSDKPAEELQTQEAQAEEAPAEEAQSKKARKAAEKAQKAEQAQKTEDAGEEKPAKKAKADKGDKAEKAEKADKTEGKKEKKAKA